MIFWRETFQIALMQKAIQITLIITDRCDEIKIKQKRKNKIQNLKWVTTVARCRRAIIHKYLQDAEPV